MSEAARLSSAPLWVRLRRLVFENLFYSLGLLLGVMQVVVGHWVTVVLAGRKGPGLGPGLLLAALLVAANAWAVPALRRARRGGGWPRRLAQLYVAVAIATLLLGAVIVLAWVGFLPLAGLLAAAGVSGEAVFAGFRVASAAVVLGLAAMLLWGFTVGQRRVERTRVRVALDALPEAHRGLRIVQISDLHIGNGMEGARLERLVDEVNRHAADVVALTGDLFDFDPRWVAHGAERLAGLRARIGVFAVLGNHDTYTGAEHVAAELARLAPNVRLLRGEIERLLDDPPLYVAGVDDPGRLSNWTARELEWHQLDALAATLPDDGPTLLLVHRPELFPQASRLGFPLVLAGHTHGGQLALPTPGGRHNLARILTRFHRGLYRENGSVLYVNRGVGVAGPAIRFNCSREIATIELV